MLVLAVQDFEDGCESLREQIGALSGSAPGLDDRSDGASARRLQWTVQFERAQLRAIEEDCCFHLPLDHPLGESFDDRPVEHWRSAREQLRKEGLSLGG